MTRIRSSLLAAALAAVLVASAASAQNVAYTGSLRIGMSDADNTIGFPFNNAIPLCAGQGPLVNPGTVGTLSSNLPRQCTGERGRASARRSRSMH